MSAVQSPVTQRQGPWRERQRASRHRRPAWARGHGVSRPAASPMNGPRRPGSVRLHAAASLIEHGRTRLHHPSRSLRQRGLGADHRHTHGRGRRRHAARASLRPGEPMASGEQLRPRRHPAARKRPLRRQAAPPLVTRLVLLRGGRHWIARRVDTALATLALTSVRVAEDVVTMPVPEVVHTPSAYHTTTSPLPTEPTPIPSLRELGCRC
jgi:hypothetical protein